MTASGEHFKFEGSHLGAGAVESGHEIILFSVLVAQTLCFSGIGWPLLFPEL